MMVLRNGHGVHMRCHWVSGFIFKITEGGVRTGLVGVITTMQSVRPVVSVYNNIYIIV